MDSKMSVNYLEFCIQNICIKISHSDAVHSTEKLYIGAFQITLPQNWLMKSLHSTCCTSVWLQQPSTNSSPITYIQFTLDNVLSDSFPQLEVLLHLFITLPIWISSTERSYSVLQSIKNYLRSMTSQECISDLALLAIEREVGQQLDISSLIKQFPSCKVNRGWRRHSKKTSNGPFGINVCKFAVLRQKANSETE